VNLIKQKELNTKIIDINLPDAF